MRMNTLEARPQFRLGVVPGVTPTKWVRTWRERLPHVTLEVIELNATVAEEAVRAGEVDAGLVRIPVAQRSAELRVIPLYDEEPVVVVPKDHYLCAAEEIVCADMDAEIVLHPLDDAVAWGVQVGERAEQRPVTTAAAVALVAAGVGVLVVPKSLARLHHRKDLTFRPIADLPKAGIGLVWDEETDLMEEFIGIVRGRTVNSSRGAPAEPAPKLTASQKAAARRERLLDQRGGQIPRLSRKRAESGRRRSRRRNGR